MVSENYSGLQVIEALRMNTACGMPNIAKTWTGNQPSICWEGLPHEEMGISEEKQFVRVP